MHRVPRDCVNGARRRPERESDRLPGTRIGVHHCAACHRCFRAQPPFLRPGTIYTNRLIDKAVQSVIEDELALRCVPERLARDFWVQPSEGSVRRWYSAYGAQFDFETDYQAWVVSESPAFCASMKFTRTS